MCENLSQIKDYKIKKLIGKGAFGCVYLVERLQQQFAAKVIFIKKDLKNALGEVEILAQSNHANITRIKDCFIFRHQDHDYLAIIMEYCSGGALSSKIGSQISDAKIKKMMKEISTGLNYLHQNKIVHRDIKPQNIFIGEGDIIKIGDFGISKILKQEKTSSIVGTPYYMDGKLYQSSPQYNYEIDIWSLGITFLELISGFRIWQLIPSKIIPSKMPGFPDKSIRNKISNKKYWDLIEGMLRKDDTRLNISGVLQILGVQLQVQSILAKEETVYEENNQKGYYSGDMVGRRKEGKGKMCYYSGEKYEGFWKNDLFHGKGTYSYANGDRYDGNFSQGKMQGRGIFKYKNKDVYNGDWKRDKKEGKGVYQYCNGSLYNGDWKEDKMDGKGMLVYPNGEYYDGYFKNNLRDGFGIIWRNHKKTMVQYERGALIIADLCLMR